MVPNCDDCGPLNLNIGMVPKPKLWFKLVGKNIGMVPKPKPWFTLLIN